MEGKNYIKMHDSMIAVFSAEMIKNGGTISGGDVCYINAQ